MIEDIDRIRTALIARREACFERLEDAVSELVAVHEMDGDVIVDRVRATVSQEDRHLRQR
jgi:hypothetical protein